MHRKNWFPTSPESCHFQLVGFQTANCNHNLVAEIDRQNGCTSLILKCRDCWTKGRNLNPIQAGKKFGAFLSGNLTTIGSLGAIFTSQRENFTTHQLQGIPIDHQFQQVIICVRGHQPLASPRNGFAGHCRGPFFHAILGFRKRCQKQNL